MSKAGKKKIRHETHKLHGITCYVLFLYSYDGLDALKKMSQEIEDDRIQFITRDGPDHKSRFDQSPRHHSLDG